MELDRKSYASFRLLVAMARADGKLGTEEHEALRTAFGRHADLLPELMAEQIDIDAELAVLDPTERRRLYQSAFALAYADGVASVDEVGLLKRLVTNDGERTLLGQVFGEVSETLVPGRIVAVADPVQRDGEITEDLLKYSVLAAVAGAMPVPGVAIVADLAVVAIQAKMVHDIGQYWGHSLDRAAVAGFIGSVAGSITLRIAANNLARFVPGWGSAFGAATSFSTTYALGRVAQRYFEAGRGLKETELRDLFRAATTEGTARFDHAQVDIGRARAEHGAALAGLSDQLAQGAISRAAYDAAVASLEYGVATNG